MKRLMLTWAVLPLLAGCSSRRISHTPRSAIEQLLLSAAVDKALLKFELPELKGSKLFIDFAHLSCYDQEYVKAATRTRMSELGAVLVAGAEDADLVAEVASGALGTEFKSSVVGLPPIPVPNSPVATPEAPAYRSEERTGIVKLLIFVHAKGRFVAASHYYAKADRDESFLLGWRYQRQDQVREGWERSDLRRHLRRRSPPASAPAPGISD